MERITYSPPALAQIPAPNTKECRVMASTFSKMPEMYLKHTHKDAREERELKDWSASRVDTNHEQLSG